MHPRFLFKAPTAAISALVLFVLGACTDDSDGISQLDTVAPTITATARVEADVVVLTATVSDNIAVTEVEFLIDSNAKATVTDSRGRTTFSTSVPVDRLSNGSHRVVARAVDAAGNATAAESVTFEIGQPAESPIKITATAVMVSANVTFTIDIESEAQIRLTNFFLDGEFLGGRGDDQRHYVFTRALATGRHSFVVDVTDVQGNSATEEVIVDVVL